MDGGRTGPLQGGGLGLDADEAVQLQQVWVEPELRGRLRRSAAWPTSASSSCETTPAVCLFVRPENAPAIGLYERIGMRRTITYRSLIFG